MLWRSGVIAGAAILTYINNLSGPFILDDQAAIVANRQIRDLWNVGAILSTGQNTSVAGRPLVNLSLAINYAMGGLGVAGYHVWNIAIHALCALAAFGVIRRTLELPSLRERFGRDSVHIAFAAALIWAVHPLNSEAVDYLIQRTESMMALCYLLVFYASTRAHSTSRPIGWQTVAVLACAAGMAAKESMATAPLLIGLYDRAYVFNRWRDAMRARGRFYAALAATWTLLAALNLIGPRAATVGFSSGVSPWIYLLNQTAAIAHYLRLAVWPRSLVVFYGWPTPATLASMLPYALLVTALLALTAIGWFLQPKLAFLGLWFFATLAPTSSFVPISTEVAAERRMYLALLPLAVLAVVAVSRVVTTALGRALLLGAVTLLLATATIVRNREYSSALSLARTVVERRPTSIGHHILGVELIAAGQHADAVAEFRQAIPGDSRARYDLGLELFSEGKLDEALAELRLFVATSHFSSRPVPHWLEPPPNELLASHVVMARSLARQQHWPQAVDEAKLALVIEPGNRDATSVVVGALTNLGVASIAANRVDEAIGAFQQAVEIQPGNGDAQRNLANALVDGGKANDALPHARQAVALTPGNSGSYDVLGRALARAGDLAQARSAFERAIQVNPADAQARDDLNRTYSH
jgi:tetratricopeptide (TPR) repeat protein